MSPVLDSEQYQYGHCLCQCLMSVTMSIIDVSTNNRPWEDDTLQAGVISVCLTTLIYLQSLSHSIQGRHAGKVIYKH